MSTWNCASECNEKNSTAYDISSFPSAGRYGLMRYEVVMRHGTL